MNFAAVPSIRHIVKFGVAEWRRRYAALGAAAVLGLAACTTLPAGGGLSKDSDPKAKADAVVQRAQARWDALLKGDVKAAYGYLSPASRAVTSLERYQAKTNTAQLRSIKLDGAKCEGEICQLKFWLTFDHRVMRGVTTPIEETWIIENGQAWFVYRE